MAGREVLSKAPVKTKSDPEFQQLLAGREQEA